MFGFAKALALGYAFVSRGGTGEQSTHFIGYESNLLTTPGTLLLDATADIDGVRQLCPWREHGEAPQARYDNLCVTYVPPFTKTRLHKFFKLAKNRRDYTAWMLATIKEHMEPGQRGLVVCKKELLDNENVPRWPEDDQHGENPNPWHWNVEGRLLSAVNWGRGIGANTWKDADVVFLFDEFHLRRRTFIATAQGLRNHKATEGDLASMKTLTARAPAVDTIQEGHLLRWWKQMALRGKGRSYDAKGVCGPQKVVCSGDIKRLSKARALFPHATFEAPTATLGSQTDARNLLAILSRPGLPPVITTRWIGQQMGKPWGTVGKNVMGLEAVKQALTNLGLTYRGGRGVRNAAFLRAGASTTLMPVGADLPPPMSVAMRSSLGDQGARGCHA